MNEKQNYILNKISILLFQTKKYELAIQEIQNALALDLNNYILYTYLAIALSSLNKTDEALIQAQKALELSPNDDYVLFVLASIYVEKKQYNSAEKLVLQALEINPFWENYYNLLAVIYLSQQKLNLALETCQKSLALNPENNTALNYKSIALIQHGNLKEAEENIKISLKENPEGENSLVNYGHLLIKQNKSKEAILKFKEALRINPNSEIARTGLLEAHKINFWLYGILVFLIRQLSLLFLNTIFVRILVFIILISCFFKFFDWWIIFILSRIIIFVLISTALLNKLLDLYFCFHKKHYVLFSEEQIQINISLLKILIILSLTITTCFFVKNENSAGILILSYVGLGFLHKPIFKNTKNKFNLLQIFYYLICLIIFCILIFLSLQK